MRAEVSFPHGKKQQCSSFVSMRNPLSLPDLNNRITVAMETITLDMLIRVWQELDYRLDVCRVTKGAHIEHL
jgi:hypothetical protein